MIQEDFAQRQNSVIIRFNCFHSSFSQHNDDKTVKEEPAHT